MATTGVYTGKYSTLDDSNQDVSTESNVDNNSQKIYTGKYADQLTPMLISGEGEPSELEKFQYGLASETYLLGDIIRLGKAGVQSIFSGKTFSEEREEEEELRLQNIYQNYAWAEGGEYDNDAMVWAGKIGIMATDPVYMFMPWARAAQAGKILGKGGIELAKLGAGVGAGDTIIRDFARTGTFNPKNILIGATAGAVLSPAITGLTKGVGLGLNKALPNLFKNKPKEIIKTIKDVHKKNYDVDDKVLERLYNIPMLPRLQKMWQSIAEGDNAYKTVLEPIETFVKQIDDATDIVRLLKDKNAMFSTIAQEQKQLVKAGVKSPFELNFKVLGGKTLQATNIKDIKKFKTKIIKELEKKKLDFTKTQNRKQTDLLIAVTKEYHNATGLTGQAMRMLAVNFTRPVVGTGMGATAGALFGNDENFKNYMIAGAGIGGLHRVLMRRGIKGIPAPMQIKFANMLKKEYWTNLDRNIRIATASTQQSKLGQRGPIMDEFSVAMFDRPADTIRLNWLGKVHKDQGSSVGLVGTGTSVEQMAIKRWAVLTDSLYEDVLKGMNKNSQRDALRIIRGASSKGMSDDSKQLAGRVQSWLDEHRAYYKEVGLTEKEVLTNYFPRKFNYKLINQSDESQELFLKDVTKIFQNITKNASKTNKVQVGIDAKGKSIYTTVELSKSKARESAEKYFKSITNTHENPIIDFQKLARGETLNVNNFKTPLNQHLDFERILKGEYKDVEQILEKYLINDIGAVLGDLSRTTSKSVEFARVFGGKGELIKTFIKRLNKQYEDAGFTKVGGMYGAKHRADLQGIRDAVNSYFGRYQGNFGKGGDTTKSMAAVLSTLANFNMMDKVTIANLGDLIQPFQNSRYFFSALQGMKSNVSKQMSLKNTKLALTNLKDAYVGGDGVVSPLSKTVRTDNVMSIIQSSNEKFFKLIGLEAITNLSRRYAYNVGAIDAHKTARSLIQGLKEFNVNKLSDLMNNKFYADEIKHLIKLGVIQTDKSGTRITNGRQIIEFGRAKNLTEAMKSKSSSNIIDRVGTKTADRDAIIPQVGNRLLFTQDKQPLIRLIGQFSSWAMAKSAQTNAMLTRIEDGNLRTAIGMAGALTMFGAVKDLRDYIKFGEFDTKDNLEDDPLKWLAEANQMSGNMGWLPSLVVNQMAGYGSSRPIEFFPAISMVSDITKATVDSTPFSTAEWDTAIREWYQVLPAPTIRNFVDKLLGGNTPLTYKKDYNILDDAMNSTNIPSNKFSTGGIADQEETFNTAYTTARNNKEELFVWNKNKYSTKNANETDEEYKQFLGVEKFKDNKVLLKNEPNKPAIKENLEEIVSDKEEMKVEKIIPKEKPNEFQSKLKQSESSGNYNVVNKQGYMGAYQFGEARLQDYKDATGEDFNKETFLGDKKLQDKVFKWHTSDIKNFIKAEGLDKAIGKKIKGVTVTLNGLIAVAHLGGREGMKEFVNTNGTYNPKDKNKTSLLDYLNKFKILKFHGGGRVSHTHGPRKSKPKKSQPQKSWKSLFTSNEAYGGPTPSVNTSNNNNNDNKEIYRASTQGGTNTGDNNGGKDSGNGGVKEDIKKVYEDINDEITKPRKDRKDIGLFKKGQIFDGNLGYKYGINLPTQVSEIPYWMQKGTQVTGVVAKPIGHQSAIVGSAEIGQSDGLMSRDLSTDLGFKYVQGGESFINPDLSVGAGYNVNEDKFSATVSKDLGTYSIFKTPFELTPNIAVDYTEGGDWNMTPSISFRKKRKNKPMKSGGLLDRKRA